ncbi:uncharacterized protein LOC132284833 [Cornus florida]|uniref:uncharacterized protein LOC132284833 n=1 Tax=Cornus florida TaxID=4283 RepID=UPI002899CD99|nr:uncharacterized protein LOC132284833 [Cornus florida]
MGIDMELEFDKYCKVGGSPKTVLPFPRQFSKVERRSTKSTCRKDLLNLKEDFKEINFRRYRSSSCKTIPFRTSQLEGNEVLKRGSVYQSSKEVRKMNKIAAVEGRRKIEFSRSNATGSSFGLLDSLCSSDEDSLLVEQKRSSAMSLNSDLNTASASRSDVEQRFQDLLDLSLHHGRDSVVSSDGLFEISLNLKNRGNHSAENVERHTIENPKFRCDPVVGPLNDGNVLRERENATFRKSLSAKLALPHSPSPSESDCSKASSPKVRFSPIRKMFDPFTKPKSQRSPLGSAIEHGELAAAGLASVRRNKTFRKSLLHDFSNVSQSPEVGSQVLKKDPNNLVVPCSPAHLHGQLKLEKKHGVPFIEFSLKFPEDVFVAKTWKADNGLNWVYTFHSLRHRRKSNASGWGLKDINKESSIVGQMQVSCYLCTELKNAGAFDSSMVTEFVLYDIAHARKSMAAQENLSCSPDVAKPPKCSNERSIGGTCELDEASDQSKLKFRSKDAPVIDHFDSNAHPWLPADLHPNLEIAAIVTQVPLEKRESLKYMRGGAKSVRPRSNSLDLSVVEQRKKGNPDCLSLTNVNVVIPSGSHSLPSTESRGPSPLLDRWRLGGGCDCGGWDMACPLTVFGNSTIPSTDDHPLTETHRPLELFVQGPKDKTPALNIRVIEEGLYSVDFHAQLSTLQAFSICVAILHSTEASIAVGQERDEELLQCNSLGLFIGKEVKYLIETVREEEKRKANPKTQEIKPSFVLNPPFSPIARV